MRNARCLDYGDLTLTPNGRGTVSPGGGRRTADLSVEFIGERYAMPVTVMGVPPGGSAEMAFALWDLGLLPVMGGGFDTADGQFDALHVFSCYALANGLDADGAPALGEYLHVLSNTVDFNVWGGRAMEVISSAYFSVPPGTEWAGRLIERGVRKFMVTDCAFDPELHRETCRFIRNACPEAKIISEGHFGKRCFEVSEADAFAMGMGMDSDTGFGRPAPAAVMDCMGSSDDRSDRLVSLGASCCGDVAKAMAIGACMADVTEMACSSEWAAPESRPAMFRRIELGLKRAMATCGARDWMEFRTGTEIERRGWLS